MRSTTATNQLYHPTTAPGTQIKKSPERCHPLFEGVAEEVIDQLFAQGTLRKLPPGCQVQDEEDHDLSFFILFRGSVKALHRSVRGLEVLAHLYCAPAVFSDVECLRGMPHFESIETIDPSLILEVPKAVLLDALGRSHALALNLLNDVAARSCIASQHHRSLAFDPVDRRLAKLFLTYLEHYGVPVEGGIKIRVRLSQEDLANLLGVARRSVTRALGSWRAHGIVTKDGPYFVIRSKEMLRELLP